MRQKGFATLEVILMVVVIAILASIAVPRFANISAKANTAKIQADLSTINTAIAVYQLEKGEDPTDITNHLVSNGYLQAKPEPPSGKCYMGAEPAVNVPGTEYTIKAKSGNVEAQAVLGTNNTADKFKLPTSTGSGSTGTPTEPTGAP